MVRSVAGLHHKDLEWLVSNYILGKSLCSMVWSGGQSFAGIDHIGITAIGGRVLAQTTRSLNLVRVKAAKLTPHAGAGALFLFAPAATRAQVPGGVTFVAIEEVFAWADESVAGRSMLDAMLGAGVGRTPEQRRV